MREARQLLSWKVGGKSLVQAKTGNLATEFAPVWGLYNGVPLMPALEERKVGAIVVRKFRRATELCKGSDCA